MSGKICPGKEHLSEKDTPDLDLQRKKADVCDKCLAGGALGFLLQGT